MKKGSKDASILGNQSQDTGPEDDKEKLTSLPLSKERLFFVVLTGGQATEVLLNCSVLLSIISLLDCNPLSQSEIRNTSWEMLNSS